MVLCLLIHQKNHTVVLTHTVTGSKKMIILELRFCHVVYKTYIQILLLNYFITENRKHLLYLLCNIVRTTFTNSVHLFIYLSSYYIFEIIFL